MKRYRLSCAVDPKYTIIEDKKGNYVKYEDVVNTVSKLVPYHETKAAKDVAERYLKDN